MKSDDEGDTPVFPSAVTQRSLSNGSMLRVLDRMGRGALTVQGFRATFKTWASERTSFQNEVVEASLAHTIGGKVEQAYRRGDMFEKRRRLMQQWATFCAAAPTRQDGNITALRSRMSA
jgi:integrase